MNRKRGSSPTLGYQPGSTPGLGGMGGRITFKCKFEMA
jgi:hypothetical protein